MRTVLTAAVSAALMLMVSATTASADMANCGKKLERSYTKMFHKVDRKARHGVLAKDAAGRNIRRFGVKWRGVVFYPTCHDLRRVRGHLKALDAPAPLPLLVRTAVKPRRPLGDVFTASWTAGPTLQRIAQCESHGNPSTDTGNGFYGKYQFTWGTWGDVGGVGNPAHASEQEQDYRAALLYKLQGPSPWPVCGYV